jgi:hypothetical protein
VNIPNKSNRKQPFSFNRRACKWRYRIVDTPQDISLNIGSDGHVTAKTGTKDMACDLEKFEVVSDNFRYASNTLE